MVILLCSEFSTPSSWCLSSRSRLMQFHVFAQNFLRQAFTVAPGQSCPAALHRKQSKTMIQARALHSRRPVGEAEDLLSVGGAQVQVLTGTVGATGLSSLLLGCTSVKLRALLGVLGPHQVSRCPRPKEAVTLWPASSGSVVPPEPSCKIFLQMDSLPPGPRLSWGQQKQCSNGA